MSLVGGPTKHTGRVGDIKIKIKIKNFDIFMRS